GRRRAAVALRDPGPAQRRADHGGARSGQPYGSAQRDRLPAGPALPGGPDDQRVEGGRAAERGRRQGGRAAGRGPAGDRAALPRMLAYEEPFEAAIVDLRYVQSAATGLTALATLRELSPGTRTIISTTDEEENRLLYLLAAFQFFEPRALLAKRADAFVTRA